MRMHVPILMFAASVAFAVSPITRKTALPSTCIPGTEQIVVSLRAWTIGIATRTDSAAVADRAELGIPVATSDSVVVETSNSVCAFLAKKYGIPLGLPEQLRNLAAVRVGVRFVVIDTLVLSGQYYNIVVINKTPPQTYTVVSKALF